jgi:zinc/manganese transport system substrate-binding protein
MVFLNKADMFVHSGLDTAALADNLLKGASQSPRHARQTRLRRHERRHRSQEVPTGKIDRSMGDVHAYGNRISPPSSPTPSHAVTLVKSHVVDPKNADLYKDNAKKFVLDMKPSCKKLKAEFAPYAGLKVVTFHKAGNISPMRLISTSSPPSKPRPAITPSPAEMRKTIDMIASKT